MAKAKTKQVLEASAADASATSMEKTVEDTEPPDYVEGADLSDDENDLHGPCNVRPVNVDTNPR